MPHIARRHPPSLSHHLPRYTSGERGPYIAAPWAAARLGRRVFVHKAEYTSWVLADWDLAGRHFPANVARRVADADAARDLSTVGRVRCIAWKEFTVALNAGTGADVVSLSVKRKRAADIILPHEVDERVDDAQPTFRRCTPTERTRLARDQRTFSIADWLVNGTDGASRNICISRVTVSRPKERNAVSRLQLLRSPEAKKAQSIKPLLKRLAADLAALQDVIPSFLVHSQQLVEALGSSSFVDDLDDTLAEPASSSRSPSKRATPYNMQRRPAIKPSLSRSASRDASSDVIAQLASMSVVGAVHPVQLVDALDIASQVTELPPRTQLVDHTLPGIPTSIIPSTPQTDVSSFDRSDSSEVTVVATDVEKSSDMEGVEFTTCERVVPLYAMREPRPLVEMDDFDEEDGGDEQPRLLQCRRAALADTTNGYGSWSVENLKRIIDSEEAILADAEDILWDVRLTFGMAALTLNELPLHQPFRWAARGAVATVEKAPSVPIEISASLTTTPPGSPSPLRLTTDATQSQCQPLSMTPGSPVALAPPVIPHAASCTGIVVPPVDRLSTAYEVLELDTPAAPHKLISTTPPGSPSPASVRPRMPATPSPAGCADDTVDLGCSFKIEPLGLPRRTPVPCVRALPEPLPPWYLVPTPLPPRCSRFATGMDSMKLDRKEGFGGDDSYSVEDEDEESISGEAQEHDTNKSRCTEAEVEVMEEADESELANSLYGADVSGDISAALASSTGSPWIPTRMSSSPAGISQQSPLYKDEDSLLFLADGVDSSAEIHLPGSLSTEHSPRDQLRFSQWEWDRQFNPEDQPPVDENEWNLHAPPVESLDTWASPALRSPKGAAQSPVDDLAAQFLDLVRLDSLQDAVAVPEAQPEVSQVPDVLGVQPTLPHNARSSRSKWSSSSRRRPVAEDFFGPSQSLSDSVSVPDGLQRHAGRGGPSVIPYNIHGRNLRHIPINISQSEDSLINNTPCQQKGKMRAEPLAGKEMKERRRAREWTCLRAGKENSSVGLPSSIFITAATLMMASYYDRPWARALELHRRQQRPAGAGLGITWTL
ncbi:hypothetical protein B0H21DRAFT_883199 [Amylocystis lapponica]|nr:hypothetical protein B0H21DRAFT_883199 [Amylocystis lapponica]